jgi:hypothetical protein
VIHLASHSCKAGGGCSVVLVLFGGSYPSPPCGAAAVRRPDLLGPPSLSSLSGAGAGAGAVRCHCGGVGIRCRVVLVLVLRGSSSLPVGSAVGGVGWLMLASCASSLVSCRSSSPVPVVRRRSLSSIVPRPRCPFPCHPPSEQGLAAVAKGAVAGVCCLEGHRYSMFRT